jgi:hypothetical protein
VRDVAGCAVLFGASLAVLLPLGQGFVESLNPEDRILMALGALVCLAVGAMILVNALVLLRTIPWDEKAP